MDFFSQNKIISYASPIDCIEDHIYKFDVEPLRYSADHLGLKFNGSWSKYEIAIVWNETNKIINLSLNESLTYSIVLEVTGLEESDMPLF